MKSMFKYADEAMLTAFYKPFDYEVESFAGTLISRPVITSLMSKGGAAFTSAVFAHYNANKKRGSESLTEDVWRKASPEHRYTIVLKAMIDVVADFKLSAAQAKYEGFGNIMSKVSFLLQGDDHTMSQAVTRDRAEWFSKQTAAGIMLNGGAHKMFCDIAFRYVTTNWLKRTAVMRGFALEDIHRSQAKAELLKVILETMPQMAEGLSADSTDAKLINYMRDSVGFASDVFGVPAELEEPLGKDLHYLTMNRARATALSLIKDMGESIQVRLDPRGESFYRATSQDIRTSEEYKSDKLDFIMWFVLQVLTCDYQQVLAAAENDLKPEFRFDIVRINKSLHGDVADVADRKSKAELAGRDLGHLVISYLTDAVKTKNMARLITLRGSTPMYIFDRLWYNKPTYGGHTIGNYFDTDATARAMKEAWVKTKKDRPPQVTVENVAKAEEQRKPESTPTPEESTKKWQDDAVRAIPKMVEKLLEPTESSAEEPAAQPSAPGGNTQEIVNGILNYMFQQVS